MAIVKGDKLSGKVSNLVYYQLNGKQVVRSRVYDVKQTAATRTSSKNFGNIKRISGGFRRGLSLIHEDYKKPAVMYAMDRAVGNWLGYVYPQLKTTELNSPYFDSVQLSDQPDQLSLILAGQKPVVDWEQAGRVIIEIPSLFTPSMKLPKNTLSLSFKLVISGINISRAGAEYHEQSPEVETVVENDTVAATTLEVQAGTEKKGYLYLAYLQIRYRTSGGWVKEKEWKPVMVVGSCYRAG